MIKSCKYCNRQPVRQYDVATKLVEVFCKCKMSKFVAYGDDQAEAVKIWNMEQDERGGAVEAI